MKLNQNTFMSLQEFLLLPEYPDNPKDTREYYHHMLGTDWVIRYLIAKKSYLKYGDEGPPIGSTVECLNAGHGGGAGVLRKFQGKDPRYDGYFALSRSSSYGEKEESISLVEINTWWREIFLYEEFSILLTKALEIISREDLLNEFKEWTINNETINKWLSGEWTPHPYRRKSMENWFLLQEDKKNNKP